MQPFTSSSPYPSSDSLYGVILQAHDTTPSILSSNTPIYQDALEKAEAFNQTAEKQKTCFSRFLSCCSSPIKEQIAPETLDSLRLLSTSPIGSIDTLIAHKERLTTSLYTSKTAAHILSPAIDELERAIQNPSTEKKEEEPSQDNKTCYGSFRFEKKITSQLHLGSFPSSQETPLSPKEASLQPPEGLDEAAQTAQHNVPPTAIASPETQQASSNQNNSYTAETAQHNVPPAAIASPETQQASSNQNNSYTAQTAQHNVPPAAIVFHQTQLTSSNQNIPYSEILEVHNFRSFTESQGHLSNQNLMKAPNLDGSLLEEQGNNEGQEALHPHYVSFNNPNILTFNQSTNTNKTLTILDSADLLGAS